MVLRQRDRRIDADAETPRTSPAPSCRLQVVFAEGCRKAVIFRRGSTRSTRLIAWDRATDTFEPGQWMRRASVYPENASLSPDGEYLLSFIGTFRPPFETYTVLSRPPYFTALALWPKGDTWGGGGTFVGPREFVLDHADAEPLLAPGFAWPGKFAIHTAGPASRARLEYWRKHRNDWQPRNRSPDRRSFVKRAGSAKLVATWVPMPRYFSLWGYEIEMRNGTVALPTAVRWADFDDNGDIVFAAGGSLDRLTSASFADVVARGEVTSSARRLADFTDMQFELVRARYATGGVAEGVLSEVIASENAFAPRLDRVSKDDRRRRIADRKADSSAR